LFVCLSVPARARARRAQYLSAASLFGILGFHVGVWAVQLAPLSAGLGLDLAALGTAVTVAGASGVITLFAGGALADRVGRRPVLAIGFAGTGTAFVLLALASSFPAVLPAVMLYGLAISFVDLGANTVGSAYEQAHATAAMTGLHAWFSAGALVGAIGSAAALRAGMSYRGVYLALAAVMAAGLIGVLLAPIPAPPVPLGTVRDRRPRRAAGMPVWRIPAVLFAIALITVTFFGDGALESFLSTYLQRTLAGGVLLSGIGIGSYHFASLLGRLIATAALRRLGEQRVVRAAGLLAAAGLLITVTVPAGAVGGLLLVGFAIAPVVPATLSLAGRSAPGRSGQAVATTTAAGYSAFIISPLTIGLLAQATSLRLALALLIPTSLAIAALATRWPSTQASAPVAATTPSRQPASAGRTQETRSQRESARDG
jgi:MFS family permease